jgi:uncharacterized protein YjbI with pentapeptide repeats
MCRGAWAFLLGFGKGCVILAFLALSGFPAVSRGVSVILVFLLLTGADLTGTEFQGALNLKEATLDNLRGAVMKGVDLRGVNLCGIDLTGAELKEARLDNLRGAIMKGVDLRGVNLT